MYPSVGPNTTMYIQIDAPREASSCSHLVSPLPYRLARRSRSTRWPDLRYNVRTPSVRGPTSQCIDRLMPREGCLPVHLPQAQLLAVPNRQDWSHPRSALRQYMDGSTPREGRLRVFFGHSARRYSSCPLRYHVTVSLDKVEHPLRAGTISSMPYVHDLLEPRHDDV
ncbi:hypothetical protein NEOLEDRAFT_391095 [Neolentinus lepideus HHB14362 ss-1]|uniref:Uncharacterized protein n=1 Tax=Neolentinus lepideus HHB14362 ss-1 TaxID=1314782 RepID=A0A165S707_9AGAM|nr:hypothetical protein NEOLEDRAFT_391095 [Neolentinus lepideus HHB14362 ss-1]